jgi:SAM-dependent methyltransferase
MQSVPVASQSSEMEAYTVQVRVCQNGVCSYRTETRYRPRVAARAARLEARAENLQRRVAYTVSVPVVTRVKRCNGRQCWYENVTTYRTETRYRMEPAEPLSSVQPSKEAAQAPTPFDAVAAMIRLIQPTAGDVVYDLGSGDGRVLVAATVGGAKAVGIEIDPDKVADARTMASVFGVQDKIKVYEGDILDYDLAQCRLVTMYLYPELMEQIAEKLPSGCKVWSYMHGLPGATKHEVDGYEFYEWIKA